MKELWQRLSLRERQWVSIAGVIILLYFGYILIWVPWQIYLNNTEERIIEKRQALNYLQQLPNTVHIANNNSPALQKIKIQSNQLLSTVENSLETYKLRIFVSEIRQQQSQEITVKFTAAGFDNIITWLQAIWQIYSIKVVAANFNATDKPGEVKAELTLKLSN